MKHLVIMINMYYCTFAVKTIIAFEMNEAKRAKAHTLHFVKWYKS